MFEIPVVTIVDGGEQVVFNLRVESPREDVRELAVTVEVAGMFSLMSEPVGALVVQWN